MLGVRHRLADAAGYATRAAAIAKTPDTGTVRTLLLARMGATSVDCSSVDVTANVIGAVPYRRLEVTARCNLQPPFGESFLEDFAPANVSVSSAMPY
jgi:hypothetical protein